MKVNGDNKPFYFIGDPLLSNLKQPIEIKKNCFLKKANETQIQLIKKRWESLNTTKLFYSPNNPYEFNFVYNKKEHTTTMEPIKNISDWKYWVLEINPKYKSFEKSLKYIQDDYRLIDKAFLLSKLNLQILGGYLSYDKIGSHIHVNSYQSYSYRPINFYNDNSTEEYQNPKKIEETNIKEIKNLIKLIQKNDRGDKYDKINKALDDYLIVFETPRISSFRIINLFAILEYLLVSNSSTEEKVSIGKQLQNKLNLLNNRSKNKILVSEYFGEKVNCSFAKVASKLYEYRSDIAHGNRINFKKDLQILNNHKLAQSFLIEIVKNTIIQALIEPDLIIDLKEC